MLPPSCPRNQLACIAIVPLAVAVTDEFLQQFAGRTSLVSDVVVDSVGARAGVVVVMVVGWRVSRGRGAGDEAPREGWACSSQL